MTQTEAYFLQAMKAALLGESVAWSADEDALFAAPEFWQGLFGLGAAHNVLPMIYEAVYACPAAKAADPKLFAESKRFVLQRVMQQTVKTAEFLELYQGLRERGLQPLVVKGIICRQLYPNPDLRASGDEDMLIDPVKYPACHQAMLECGMSLMQPDMNLDAEPEVPYRKAGSPIYIELHKYLFPPESGAYGDLNRFFTRVHDTGMDQDIEGVPVHTMRPDDHLFYLILHAFKHFLHSGFGIRQVCDIAMYAQHYGAQVDWDAMLGFCREVHVEQFTAAVFNISRKYLAFSPEQACQTEAWLQLETEVDEGPMLADLLESGIYGYSSRSRMHSSNMTLDAVAAGKQGRTVKRAGFLSSAFPSVAKLKGRFPWLERFPFLLPIAWIIRLVKYRRESAGAGSANSAAEAIRIGRERVELLKLYGIIEN